MPDVPEIGRHILLRPSRLLNVAVHARSTAQGFGKSSTVPKDLQMPKDVPVVSKLEWQRPLQLVKYPDPRLRAPNAKVGVFDASLMELVNEMIPIMYQDDGVGLAAPQVGVNVRLMVFNPYGKEKPGAERVLVNPEIVAVSKERVAMEEGCLSFPKIYGPVDRPRDITVRAQNEKGEAVTLTLGGPEDEAMWVSRIFQHEYDHLNGTLFHDRMKSSVLESVRAKLLALEEGFVKAHPGLAVQR
eukprot:CAMPEP_0202866288 /NCGR_PEP_ID=MMETSP1391-20130828/7303_1 /ASSEMBLY_ACC=CAM_ASM_000867 /TAXON_ID=1034604 /ORGANISM="Chlamydomonas leiostraca, Strain SAG 11-49" /LENGTH=242 /DNA_ID=CAMNT_0049546221 /DNA_START=89 /DNA_END=814 /DNA_ORIENTATION=-